MSTLTRSTVALPNLSDAQEAVKGRLSYAFEQAAVGMALISPEGQYLKVNEAYCRFMGRTADQLCSTGFQALTHHLDDAQDAAVVRALLSGEIDSFKGEKRYVRPEGSIVWGVFTVRLIRDEVGVPLGLFSQIIDISEDKEAEAALRESEERLRLLAEGATDFVVYRLYTRPQLSMEYMSSGSKLLTGYAAEEHYRNPDLIYQSIHPDDMPALRAGMADPALLALPLVLRWVHPDGQVVWASARNKPIFGENGELVGVDGIAYNITDRVEAEQALRWRTHHDPLTRLPNRTGFRESLASDLSGRTEHSPSLAVFSIGLEHFSATVDAFGDDYGEKLIVQVADRLTKRLACACLSRVDRSRFALVMSPASAKSVQRVANKILACFEVPFRVEGQPFRLDASVGVSLAPAHGKDPERLIWRADRALAHARDGATGHAVYATDMDVATAEHISLLGELRQALESGETELYYQPKMRLDDGTVYGVEALMRWHHPKLGFVPPDKFIPLAERSGLVKPLTSWVLDTAVRQVAQWRQEGFLLNVAINVTARTLQDVSFVAEVVTTLQKWGLPATSLTLEITERSVLTDPRGVAETCRQLSELGVCISLDDFGTGQSALATVTMLPIGEIKIDRSFVKDAVSRAQSRGIVSVVVSLAKQLGQHCVAEGVEDAETQQLLTDLGCEAVQGYYLSRPVPAAELAQWLSERGTARMGAPATSTSAL